MEQRTPPFQLNLFGLPHINTISQEKTQIRSRKGASLLAYLVQKRQPVPRSQLAALFWPDKPEANGRNNLSGELKKLTKLMPNSFISTHHTIEFSPPPDALIDCWQVNHVVSQRLTWPTLLPLALNFLLDNESSIDPLSMTNVISWARLDGPQELSTAANLYRGEFLEGINLPNCADFEIWLMQEREYWRQNMIDLWQTLAAYQSLVGNNELSLQYARRILQIEPWLEEIHQLIMLILARQGKRREALEQYQQCQQALMITPSARTQEIYQAITAHQIQNWSSWPAISIHEKKTWPPSPYIGLDTFTEAEADQFFGRETLVNHLISQISQNSFVAVLGASGSGKSSAVQAGVIPAIRQSTTWEIAICHPNTDPLLELGSALLKAAKPSIPLAQAKMFCQQFEDGKLTLQEFRAKIAQEQHNSFPPLLLIIDQFEELFTQVEQPNERERFITAVLTAITTDKQHPHPIRVMITMRAAFLGSALQYPALAKALGESIEITPALTPAELRLAIEQPAQMLGILFEPGLVERILADIYTEPEPLPLLEFALTRLWQWEQTNRAEYLTLSHQAYEEIGGVAGALTGHAQYVVNQLPSSEQNEVRNVLLQLIRPGLNTVDTRRIASKQEMTPKQWQLISYLADNRLVVTSREANGKETAQIIHEALLRSWPQLQTWINDNRSFRVWQERLRQTIAQWEKLGRDDSGLLSGAILGEAEEWLAKQPENLTAVEYRYLQFCINKRDARLAAEEKERRSKLHQAEALATAERRQVQIEQKNNSRLRRFITILTIFFVIILGAGAIAVQQSQRAQTLADLSQSLNLASNAQLALLEGNSSLALALALEANKIENPPTQVRQILSDAAYHPGVVHVFTNHQDVVNRVLWSPDSTFAISASDDHSIIVWDMQTREMVYQLVGPQAHTASVKDLVFAPSGDSFFSVGLDQKIFEWELTTGEQLQTYDTAENHAAGITAVTITPDGETLLSGDANGQIIRWDIATQTATQTYSHHTGAILRLATSPDGRRFLSGSADGTAAVWQHNATTPRQQIMGNRDGVTDVAFINNGRTLAIASNDITLWHSQTGELLNSLQISAIITSLAIENDEIAFVAGTDAGNIQEHHVNSFDMRYQLTGHNGPIKSISYSANNRFLLTASTDGTIRLWDNWSGAEINRFEYPESPGLLTLDLIEDETAVIGTADGKIITQSLNDSFTSTQIQVSPDWIWGGTHILPDQKTAVFGSGSRFEPPRGQTLHLMDIASGELLPVPEFRDGVSRLDLSPNGRWVLFTDLNGRAWRWDLQNRSTLEQIDISDPNAAMGVEFAPDGQTGLVSFNSGTVYHIDLNTGEVLGRLDKHVAPVRALHISQTGQQAYSGAFDQLIHQWDLETEAYDATLEGHQEFISQIRTIPGHPEFVLTTSADKSMILWDTTSGEILRHYQNFIGNPLDLRLSADGHSAYTVEDREAAILREWRIDLTEEELNNWIVQNRFVPEFTCEQRIEYNIRPLCPIDLTE